MGSHEESKGDKWGEVPLSSLQEAHGTVGEGRGKVRVLTSHPAWLSLSAFRIQSTDCWLLLQARGTNMVQLHLSHSLHSPFTDSRAPTLLRPRFPLSGSL